MHPKIMNIWINIYKSKRNKSSKLFACIALEMMVGDSIL